MTDKKCLFDEKLMITVWKDGTWKLWSKTDAQYAENDPNWLSTIPADGEILDELIEEGLCNDCLTKAMNLRERK